jgi:hypothetical protein
MEPPVKLDAEPMLRWITVPPSDRSDARAWHRARTQGWITDDCADRLLLRYANIQYELVYNLSDGPDQVSTQAKAEAHLAEPGSSPGRST